MAIVKLKTQKQKTAASKPIGELLVVKITPPLIQRDYFWFQENEKQIKNSLEQLFSPWHNQALIMRAGFEINLNALLKELDELNYQRVQSIDAKGQYSIRGGIIDIFPLNCQTPYRVELLGNAIDLIEEIGLQEIEREKETRKRLLKNSQHELENLKTEDFIVHIDHGIGQFKQKKDAQYFIEYAAGDILIVPEYSKDRLTRYLGFSQPKVHRLSSAVWFKTKRKVKKEAENIAKELLELYAKRATAKTKPLSLDNNMQKDFESMFEYELTPDQETSLREIKKDLEKEQPMDRLLTGDVGFGKTEIAFRTAFKIIQNNGQAALLSPTTILAHQHFENACERFQKFPVNIALLSRLQSRKETNQILDSLKSGKIDFIIGTHRLLSKDVSFNNLELLIIDEEQHFGVKQKEKIKQLRPTVHTLSLSATPIPRTLYTALINLKSISNIQTPPPDRKPIQTFVKKWDAKLIKKAIEEEIRAGGQVYFLHNRIDTINSVKLWLGKLLPQASFALIHGRLKENELLRNIQDFKQGKKQILIATTIIENGLDLPNVNTLIVSDASRLGLSQAHQLRGRIGRRDKIAKAYFLYKFTNEIQSVPEEKTIQNNSTFPPACQNNLKAIKRLEALQEFQGLGQGYNIALKDLEIRGAGNILGKEQSGSINSVGFNLYCEMLAEAVEKYK